MMISVSIEECGQIKDIAQNGYQREEVDQGSRDDTARGGNRIKEETFRAATHNTCKWTE